MENEMVLNNLNCFARKILNRKMYFEVRKFYFTVRKIAFRKLMGGDMYCPCCGNHIKNFINFKYKSNHYNPQLYIRHYKNTICPICCSLPRQRMVAVYINEMADSLKNKEILFFAPSYAGEICMKRLDLIYKSADLYQFADIKIDIQDICLPDASIDVILCNHVLEHVPKYKSAIQEMYRVLRVGGILELSVPQFKDGKYTLAEGRDGKENWEKYGQADHLRVFGSDIREILEENGFAVVTIEGKEYADNVGCKLGPADYDIDCIYICKK